MMMAKKKLKTAELKRKSDEAGVKMPLIDEKVNAALIRNSKAPRPIRLLIKLF